MIVENSSLLHFDPFYVLTRCLDGTILVCSIIVHKLF
jgi:hypothetical protein